jgi:hypothetical protein
VIRISNIKKKLRPDDFYRIGEHESWFSDMAARGLMLKKMGLNFAHFTKGQKKKIRYRIDVSMDKEITEERKEIYSLCGWDFVTSYGEFNVFSSPEEVNAPELHTDPAEQAYTLDHLHKKFKSTAFFMSIGTVLFILLVFADYRIDPSIYLSMLDGRITQQIILIIVYLYLVYNSIEAAISIGTLRKTLSEGRPINHNAPWKRKLRLRKIVSSIYILLLIIGGIIPLMQIIATKSNSLPVTSNNLPIVRLAEVEKNSIIDKTPSYLFEGEDYGNRYTYMHSLFSPYQYQSDEEGIVKDKMWKDNSGVYSPSIQNWVYKLTFPSMSEKLLSDLIRKYGLDYLEGNIKEIENSYFDKLIINEGDSYREVFACRGKAVIYIRYYGYADIDLIIKAAEEKINLILS